MRAGELYATAAWLGALLLIKVEAYGIDSMTASGLAMVAVLTICLAAIRYH